MGVKCYIIYIINNMFFVGVWNKLKFFIFKRNDFTYLHKYSHTSLDLDFILNIFKCF